MGKYLFTLFRILNFIKHVSAYRVVHIRCSFIPLHTSKRKVTKILKQRFTVKSCWIWLKTKCDRRRWVVLMVYRSVAHSRYGLGAWVTPSLYSRVGCSPAGAEKENLWRRPVKKRNNSILASCSPRQTRFPGNGHGDKKKIMVPFGSEQFRPLVWGWFAEVVILAEIAITAGLDPTLLLMVSHYEWLTTEVRR